MTLRRGLLAGLGVLIAALAAAAIYLSLYRLEGYYAPIYASDGKSIYYVQRNTTGLVWGLGWEFFTTPAHSWALSDNVSIRRLDIDSGAVTVLREWTSTPVIRRHLREYRGRVFQILRPRLGMDEVGNLHYAIELNVTRVPLTELNALNGQIAAGNELGVTAGWQEGYGNLAAREGLVLSGPWEIMEVPGRESYPAAIAAFAAKTGEVRVLIASSDFDGLYPDGVPLDLLRERSRRPGIERIQEIERVHRELVARYQSEGLGEGDAMLRAHKEMQRLGYYPKSPTLTARLMRAGEARDPDVPEFAIEQMQFTVGLFSDIEQAIAAPGTAVDKDWSGYIIHDDYQTSQQLNAHLATGANRFYVRHADQVYELTIERP
ncbi:MAG: hypothetical protein ACREEE_09050 [Dongiaceae bacterium]